MRADERQAMALLAHLMLQNGQPEKAMALLDSLDALLPADPATLQALAVAQIRSGHPAAATQTLDRLEVLDDRAPLQHLLRAQVLVATGQQAKAEAEMARFLARPIAQRHESAIPGATATETRMKVKR